MDVPEKESKSSPKKKGGLLRLIGMVLIGLLIMGVAGGVGIWIKNRAEKQRNLEDNILQELKQPQKLAIDAIAADSGAKEALGDDIKDAGGLARDESGELERTGTVLHFDVTGSKGKGRVSAPAAHQEGAWQITGEIEIKLANGKTIRVAKPADKPPEIEF
ncbi:MAG: hypothetical protein K8R36_06290 [Planctomycetales bacterium]|nr:hypothetical protein [Planctomycetales bacterium]